MPNTAHTESPTVHQSSVITGSGATHMVGHVGGNAYFGNVSLLSETQYFEPKLDGLEQDDQLIPARADHMAVFLSQYRLLILAGPLDDKTEAARQVAFRLLKVLSKEDQSVEVRERWPGRDPQGIENAFRQPTLLLLPD